MGFIVNREGDIQTGRIEITLNDDLVRRARSVGSTRLDGAIAVIAEELGVEIEGAQEVVTYGERIVLKSNWARPSRS